MRADVADLLQTHCLVLDGGLASELESHGEDLQDPLWSARTLLESPEVVQLVHESYFRAGADIVTTASYQATIKGLTDKGLESSEAEAILKRSVALAVDARRIVEESDTTPREKPRLVAASIGSYGAFLANGAEYTGDYDLTVSELMDFHRPRLQILLESEADLIACETIPCAREAVALARLLDQHSNAAAWISFSCRDGENTCAGEPIREAVESIAGFSAVVAVGANCTPPRYMSNILRELGTVTKKPLVCYPNAGEEWVDGSWEGDSSGADLLGTLATTWRDLGAAIIGGCCRTGPAHTHSIAIQLSGGLGPGNNP